jgi:beta-lactamase regulating signal transducer with metallopeptidase domain
MSVTSYLISKVIISSGIAVVAEAVRRCSRHVALAYAMWAMVLVVLIMPPMLVVPVPDWVGTKLASLSFHASWLDFANIAPTTHAGRNEAWSTFTSRWLPNYSSACAVIWLVGGCTVLWRHARHVRFVERLVRFAASASPVVLNQCALVARELGIRACPDVVTAGGAFSPFLWHPLGGQPRIVLPTTLFERLSPAAIGAILRHELIHLRRRDAWRHRVEFVVLVLWWWLPTTWLARRRLRELEELCTDAEVLRSDPQGAKVYGHALLDTEEFLSHSRASRWGFVLAFMSPEALKTRITAIAAFTPSRAVPPARLPTYGLVAVSAALGLSVAGSLSSQPSGVPLTQAANAAIDKPVLHSQPLAVPKADHDEFASIGPPDMASVEVRHAAHEIVLSWPGDSPLAAKHVIRLIRISTADVWPPLWRIDGDPFGAPASRRLHSRQLEWIFAFLGADDVVIDEDGTRHSHPGPLDVTAA